MKKGRVKWFDTPKGYGFITAEDGRDIFVHYSGINMDGFRMLTEGQEVSYETQETYKGTQAVNVTVL